jgi:signal transduction histidine kinase
LVQQLDELERDLQQTRQGVLMAIVLFGAVVSLLTLWFGRRYLAQPLQELARAMEQVRGGDLSSGVPPRPRDEIGEVVTAFNLMVADLREARTALDDAQQERLRDQKALQQADKLIAIGQLSAGLAHEIGSPLQVLAGRARSLAKRAEEPQEVRRIADILVSQTERITRIVEQLMHFARRQPSRLAEVDVPACARQVCDLLEVEARRHNVALQLECDQQVPAIIGNSDQVQQVLFNLISNALQATKQGGKVTVEVHGPEPKALVPTVQLLVRDNGCGIPPEVVPRLFDPFFTTRSGEGGTGLGLPVVKSILTEHRGAIRIDSLVAEGTVVAVDWPLGPPQ